MSVQNDRKSVYGSYDLAVLAGIQPGKSIILRGIEPRRLTEQSYERVLRSMLRELAALTREQVIKGYAGRQNLTGDAAASLTVDNISEWFSGLNAFRPSALSKAEIEARALLYQEMRAHANRWVGLVRAQLSVDLENVVRVEALGNFMDGVALRTAGLIAGLYDDTVRSVARITQAHVLKSGSTNDLRKALVKQLGVSSRRAKLIAVDQTGTLVSELNQIRQEQAGVQSYTWSSSRDERTRQLHYDLDGKKYKWGESTGAEGGLPPGSPIRCRCVARAVLEV